MFDSRDEPGATSEPLPYRNHPGSTRPVQEDTPRSGMVTGIDMRSLPAGTEVIVDTCHSRYRFVMRDGGGRNAQVEGGRHFPREVTARVEGSTLGGSPLKVGWVGLGWFVELSFDGKRIITSQVRSICLPEKSRDEHSLAC